jgi:parvulin-like peptidyl-prolyl isomerase
VTPPFQTHLGFHVVELTDVTPSRELSFDEARAEIASTLASEKRFAAIKVVQQQLAAADFIRTPQ